MNCCNWNADCSVGVGAGASLRGVEGVEEIGVRSGDAPTGVAVLEGSWLGTGVISVPISLIETALIAGKPEE